MWRVEHQGFVVGIQPALADNYIHLVAPENTDAAIAIDPADAEQALAAARALGRRITHVLNTHHHWDHTGGNEALAQEGAEVWGPANETIPARTRGLSPEARVVCAGVSIKVLD
ncbi:MAG: MBL fold metallo-hydrolase, partial [Zetaproteobacteria bacterium]